MQDMIDELFHGNLDPDLLELKKGSAYNKKRHEILTLIESLEDNGNKQEAVRLGDAISDLDYIVSRAYFSIGFRWGARMAIAMMTDDHSTFSPVI